MFVVASTRRRRSVSSTWRVATLGSGGLATLGCGITKGGTLGGDIGCFGGRNNFEVAWTSSSRQGETLGKFGVLVRGRGSAVVFLADKFRPPVRCFRLLSARPPWTGNTGFRMEPRGLRWVREVLVRLLGTLVVRRSDKAPAAARTRLSGVTTGLEIYLCL